MLSLCTYNYAVQEQHDLLLAQIKSEASAQDSSLELIEDESSEKKVRYSYDNQDLVTIINTMASLKGVNVIFPSKETDKIKTRVTISLPEQLTLDQAWDLTLSLLDINGYSIIQEGEWFEIVKNSKDIAREPLPLYIGVVPDKLPDSDLRIRYIYYLSNLKIAQNATTDPKNELNLLLTKLLPEIKDKESKNFYLDNKTNSIIVAEKANAVKAAMKIIDYLDKIQLQEKMEIVPLRFLSADTAAKLFANIQEPLDKNRYRLEARAPESSYFSPNTKVMAYGRTNSLIILGKSQDIERIKAFIYKYLDVPLDQGESMLHVYQLQYLDASSFVEVVKKIVASQKTTGQAAGGTKPSSEPLERYFDDVKIMADTPGREEKSTAEEGGRANIQENMDVTGLGRYSGGNKLVIAARAEDWVRIKKLIEELDTPQPQVVIEVLIAELTTDQIRQIGTALRNPACLPLPNTMNAQSAQIAQVITDNTNATPTKTLQSNLLGQVIPSGSNFTNIASLATTIPTGFTGPTVISFNDKNGSTWGLTEILDFIDAKDIIANPHVIAINNKKTHVQTVEERLLPSGAVNNTNFAQIKRTWIKAPINLYITPRISSANTVNLSLEVNIARFDSVYTEGLTNQRSSRDVITNANVYSGDILTIGGLNRMDTTNSMTETPILGQLPFIGWLFKNRRKREQKTNLTIFICPTIIQPRLRAGVSTYTTDYINITKSFSQDGFLFDSLRDPITRWFFKDTEDNPLQSIDDFMTQDTSRKKEEYGPVEQKSDLQTLVPVSADTALQEVVKKHEAEDLADEEFINEPINTLQDAQGRAPISAPAVSREYNQLAHTKQPDKLDLLAAQVKDLYKEIPDAASDRAPSQALRA